MVPVYLASLAGLVIYLAVPNAKVSEAGRIVFSWSVLAVVLRWAGLHF